MTKLPPWLIVIGGGLVGMLLVALPTIVKLLLMHRGGDCNNDCVTINLVAIGSPIFMLAVVLIVAAVSYFATSGTTPRTMTVAEVDRRIHRNLNCCLWMMAATIVLNMVGLVILAR
jgi:hypothetical protein